MSKVNSGWTVVDESIPLLTYHYSFGPGLANALAIGGPEGFVIVSPPCRVPDAAFTELEARGKIRGLVASNAFHHLGIPPWKARFPDAAVFAPAQAIARVEKQTKLTGIQPVANANALMKPGVELVDMPHYKTGEVLVKAKTASDLYWYVTDVIMNMPKLPALLPVKLLFKWTNSAPGLKLNNVAPVFMVKDKKALRRWLLDEIAAAPPSVLVPCHGPIVRMAERGKELREIFPAS